MKPYHFTRRFLLLIVFLSGIQSNSFAGDTEEDSYGMRKGDLAVSIGGGKNIYFDPEFDLVAPYMIPVALDFAVADKVEIGVEYTPVFFADRSNVNFVTTGSEKNHNFGNIHAMGLEAKYALYNDYGVMAYAGAGGKYNVMSKNQFVSGVLNEIKGTGHSIVLGLGVRYQLSDVEGDVYPWYFEMGLNFSKIKYEISDYMRDGATLPLTSVGWNDLNFTALDVAIRFGYRFRKK